MFDPGRSITTTLPILAAAALLSAPAFAAEVEYDPGDTV